ncbi:DUF2845 domain-containing protein [Dyella flagellata]|uniref:DUF2845 domain-containing protein n=1 Tax=Dyella flagellata TaxID=1867833 RepID=A0ABQ5X898_9GAMM|nr:DUF2845 domain-containing protein [Dyella flagellata]GLQ87278.1 hypothetical protein GCM10007898_08440 [Dyella flagellata]
MSRYLLFALLLASIAVHAETSLRIGSKVLTLGDSAAKVQQLMGEPTVRTFLQAPTGAMPNNQLASGEQWQYTQGNKTIVITIVNGRVTNFETLYD